MNRARYPLAVFLLLTLTLAPFAEETAPATAAAAAKAEPYSKEEFPLWSRDLRRAEVVAFGSLPLTLFFSKIAVDGGRWSSHDWDMSYAPWPLKSAGAIEMSEKERVQAFTIACASSVVVALVDYVIVHRRRVKAERAERAKKHSSMEIDRGAPPGGAPPISPSGPPPEGSGDGPPDGGTAKDREAPPGTGGS